MVKSSELFSDELSLTELKVTKHLLSLALSSVPTFGTVGSKSNCSSCH